MAEIRRNGSTTHGLPTNLMMELGTTGLRRYGGYIREQYLPALVGLQGVRTFKQMGRDSILGGVLYANETLIRQAGWRVDPADHSNLAQAHADLVDSMLFQDMSQSWPVFLSEALSFQLYGWAYHEICWKRRLGEIPPSGYDPTSPEWDWWATSQYDDGLIAPRKLPIRSQDTLLQWEFDRSGGVQAMVQQDPIVGKQATIPIDKALLFRLFSEKANPEGRSLFLAAYDDWYAAKHIKRIEGIGIERDLAGMFHARLPPEYLSANASLEEANIREYVKKMVTQVHRDELEGLVTPLAYDANGNELFQFELLTTGGTRQFDTTAIIQRYDTRKLQAVLANILMVGMQGRTGSYSLGETLSDLYMAGLTAIAHSLTEVLNRHLLPRIWALNALPRATMPRVVHGHLKQVDFDKFTSGVLRLSQAGMVLTPQDEIHIRMESGFPHVVPDAQEEI